MIIHDPGSREASIARKEYNSLRPHITFTADSRFAILFANSATYIVEGEIDELLALLASPPEAPKATTHLPSFSLEFRI